MAVGKRRLEEEEEEEEEEHRVQSDHDVRFTRRRETEKGSRATDNTATCLTVSSRLSSGAKGFEANDEL